MGASNIGAFARTPCSGVPLSPPPPNAPWESELQGEAAKRLERTWANVVLLVVDEVSFIGRSFFARMHVRLQQGRRRFFSEAGLDPNRFTFGHVSIILVGDLGQLEPIDDWSMCDTEATFTDCPARLRHLWKHQLHGLALLETFKEAVMLKHIHRSTEDVWASDDGARP